MKRRIFVVDDHPIMRWGYVSLINREPDLEVCCEAGTAEEALVLISGRDPDVAVVDLALPDMNGIELTKRLLSLMPGLRVLVVSPSDKPLYAERSLRAGARAYLRESEVHATVVVAIRRVLDGKLYLSEAVNDQIIARYIKQRPSNGRSTLERLTDREFEVFEQIGRGLSTGEIAAALHISPKTVESHRGRIKTKLDLATTTRLVQRAVQWVQEEEVCGKVR